MRIVKNGDVHVSAPIGMPREKVMAFIDSRPSRRSIETVEGAGGTDDGKTCQGNGS